MAMLLSTPLSAFVAPHAAMPTARFGAPLMSVEAVTPEVKAAVTPEVEAEPTAPPKPLRKAQWNPQGLGVPPLPGPLELFGKQFEPAYLTTAPAYLPGPDATWASIPGPSRSLPTRSSRRTRSW